MTAWFQGQDPLTGLFRVQFSDDAPTRLVSQIRPR